MSRYLLILCLAGCNKTSDLKDDEVVQFIPTYGTHAGTVWKLPLQAWVYEPEASDMAGTAALAAVKQAVEVGDDAEAAKRITTMMQPFMVDNERDKDVVVRVGEATVSVGTSGADGRCGTVFELPDAAAPAGALEYEAVLRRGDSRHFEGWVTLLEDSGVSVISDIDDTIKITMVHDKKEMLANTFARPFRPAPGMAALYRRWSGQGAAFHYISNSPLPLLGAITGFFEAEGFPMGSVKLKPFRWTDGTFLELLAAPEAHKQSVIEEVIDSFEVRSFVLVGDTGERDPEIYAAVARKYPKRIAKIYLRDPQGGTDGLDGRLGKAYDGLPEGLFAVFTDTSVPDVDLPTR